MKTKLILALVCAALFLTAHAQAQTLDDANRDFTEGHYHASTLGYQSVLAQKGYSAPVLFDLGNSYFREGDFADAILAYQRAQWLSPNNPDILANLSLAQKQAGLPVLEPRWSDQLTGVMGATDWAWLGSGALTLLCLSLLARAALPAQRIPFSFSCVASALVLFAALTAMALSSKELHKAVVIDKNASALISPFPAAQAAFAPVPGEVVTTGKPYHDFILVKDAAGHTGWISKVQIAQIIPPALADKTL
jgi:hypothetical protein